MLRILASVRPERVLLLGLLNSLREKRELIGINAKRLRRMREGRVNFWRYVLLW